MVHQFNKLDIAINKSAKILLLIQLVRGTLILYSAQEKKKKKKSLFLVPNFLVSK
jgi:hypothetical protein